MTVKQLIKKLQKVKNQNASVIVSCDAEGNYFNLLSNEISRDLYFNEHNEVLDSEDLEINDLPITKCKKCVVLWPE